MGIFLFFLSSGSVPQKRTGYTTEGIGASSMPTQTWNEPNDNDIQFSGDVCQKARCSNNVTDGSGSSGWVRWGRFQNHSHLDQRWISLLSIAYALESVETHGCVPPQWGPKGFCTHFLIWNYPNYTGHIPKVPLANTPRHLVGWRSRTAVYLDRSGQAPFLP